MFFLFLGPFLLVFLGFEFYFFKVNCCWFCDIFIDWYVYGVERERVVLLLLLCKFYVYIELSSMIFPVILMSCAFVYHN